MASKKSRNGKRMVRIKGKTIEARKFTPTEEAFANSMAAKNRRRAIDALRAQDGAY